MSSNGKGSYRTTRKLTMQAFDKLPADVRQALAHAGFNYVPQQILTRLRHGEQPAILIALIDRQDMNKICSGAQTRVAGRQRNRSLR